MFFSLFKCLAVQLGVGMALLITISLLQLIFYDTKYVLDFLKITVLDMKGLGVWCFGVGLMVYVTKHGKEIAQDLNLIFMSSPSLFEVTSKIENSTLHRKGVYITGPVTIFGALMTFNYEVPHYGVSAFFISSAVVFIYYTAAFLLYHFYTLILAFQIIHSNRDGLCLEKSINGFCLENISTYLALTSTIGLFAIYLGFRGTVTAGFSYTHPVWEFLLVTPLILFLPGTLFYNFYPRHVLKKIFQYKIFSKLISIATSDDVDIKNSIVDIKEASLINSQIAPFVDYKNLPSYVISIMFLLNVVYKNDPAIKNFFKFIFGN